MSAIKERGVIENEGKDNIKMSAEKITGRKD